MSDSEHHWVYAEGRLSGLIEACPLIIGDDGEVEGIMVGLMLITDLDGLKERAWTISKVDNMNEPSQIEFVWAAEGHGVIEGEHRADESIN